MIIDINKFNARVKHRGRQKCTLCDHRSLSGLNKGCGKCTYHFTLLVYGQSVVDKIYKKECLHNDNR
jgi:hypothetical protein